MSKNEKISYVEFQASNLAATKAFFQHAFGWTFQDFGPDYTSFSDQGLDGGFYTSEKCSQTENGGALVVLYSEDLEATKQKLEAAGGMIVREIFEFPGGRRFHFSEPSGNEFAVWSE